ncbi:inorganic triphosphatase [Neptuniibacter sp. 2_MG-2023]|uniref:CYTH domain-containing protein n=1 Tax=Neptuniibacter sp. 2_MG-2023 TaxID=3062671 RepID=UPI0026E26EB4|nr:CYTH domain-containing protein [Neptuniibacter sp. 2_MG-2023]MDO6514966.1 CYTH domain-containing protein [Neptuniibacter sp. 2_MG-2023]
MALEVELKLTLSPHHIESLKRQPLFRSQQIRELKTEQLGNTYYDTPDQLLTQHKVALRIRKKGEQLIQTLKSSGSSEAGLHSRNEWEWLLNSPELDFQLLASAEWPKALDSKTLQSNIAPIFTTNFQRTTWILDSLDSQGQVLKAEIALDQGTVTAAGKEDTICELEIELLEGNGSELVKFALKLAKHVPLYISDVSKAERGYRLLQPDNYEVHRTSAQLDADTSLEQAFIKLLKNELSLWPRYFEAWHFTNNWKFIPLALESLRNVSACYESFSSIIPAEPDGVIDKLLTKLIRQLRDIDAWRRTALLSGHKDNRWFKQQAEQAAARINVLLQTAEPGVLALLISEQLIEQTWRSRWNEHHKQLAKQTLFDK